MSPMMISPGQVPVIEAQASANAERAHQRMVEKRLDRPSRRWTAEGVTRTRRARRTAKLHPPQGYVGQGAHNVIRVEPDGRGDRRMEPQDRLRTIRTVFTNATDRYSAIDQLRARGFRIDLAASTAGDLIVSIQAGRTRADEVGALVAAHDGRIERPLGGSARFNPSPWTVTNRRPMGVRP